MKKFKISIAIFLPIFIGIVGMYIYVKDQVYLYVRYGKEGFLEGAFHAMIYYFVFVPCAFIVAVFAMGYILKFLNRLRYRLGIIFLILLYPVLLVVMPYMAYKNKFIYNHFEVGIKKDCFNSVN